MNRSTSALLLAALAAVLLTLGACGRKNTPAPLGAQSRMGQGMELVSGTADIESVNRDFAVATARMREGRRTVYWNEHTLFTRKGKGLDGVTALQTGDRIEFRGVKSPNLEIYLTRVDFLR